MSEQFTISQTEKAAEQPSTPSRSFLHTMLFFFFVALFLAALIYLVYHNGKSLYVDGI